MTGEILVIAEYAATYVQNLGLIQLLFLWII